MQIYSRAKQYYTYLRNWRKLRSRQGALSKNEVLAKELDFYSQLIRTNDLCFDIGANIGDKTELFLRLGATVVAVEPQESCWRVLKRRFENHSVFIEPVALADRKGSKTLFIDRSHTLATVSQDWLTAVKRSGRFPRHKWTDKLSVPATTLDALVEKYGKPAFCKIDVEGFECDVLHGLSQPIKIISLEFVAERIDASLCCVDYLSKLGNAQFNYSFGGSMSFALSDWVDSRRMESALTSMTSDIQNYGDIYVRFLDERKRMVLTSLDIPARAGF